MYFLALALVALGCAEDRSTRGFDHFYNLEFDQAVSEFEKLAAESPGDPQAHNHVAQAILYREMLRSGALESELVTGNNPVRRERLKPSAEDQRKFESSVAKALELTQAMLAKSPNDVAALYAQGVSHGLRGNYNFLVKKAWIDALRDITTSRKLHSKVTQLKPDYHDARLVQGVHDYTVSYLPFTYRMLGFVVGFRGDREGGIRTLQLVAAKGVKNRTDAKVLLAVVYRRERKPAEGIALLKELIALYPRNYIFRLEMVQLYGDLGDKESALAELRNLDQLKQVNSPGLAQMPAERINLARGTLLFWYREYDVAISELRKVTARAKEVDLNTGSMAWFRLGQCYDMRQRREDAAAAFRQAIAVAPESDGARQSREFVDRAYRRPRDQ